MLFTIAIPTYNNEATIGRTIQSCLNQRYTDDYEILILNNSSTDKTTERIESFKDSRINHIQNSSTVTMYENHNLCLKSAKGDYTIFCHSDDELNENALGFLSKELEKLSYPSKMIVWGRSYFRDYHKNLKRVGGKLNNVLPGNKAKLLALYWGLTPSGTCYSTNSINELQGFFEVKERLAPSDIASFIYFAQNKFDFLMLDKYLFNRVDASTAIDSVTPEETLRAVNEAFQELFMRSTEEQKKSLIEDSLKLKDIPTLFYHVLYLNGEKKNMIKQKCIKTIILRPYMILNKHFRFLLNRVFLSR